MIKVAPITIIIIIIDLEVPVVAAWKLTLLEDLGVEEDPFEIAIHSMDDPTLTLITMLMTMEMTTTEEALSSVKILGMEVQEEEEEEEEEEEISL